MHKSPLNFSKIQHNFKKYRKIQYKIQIHSCVLCYCDQMKNIFILMKWSSVERKIRTSDFALAHAGCKVCHSADQIPWHGNTVRLDVGQSTVILGL